MVMPTLLLQKPHACSKTEEYLKCLESRLAIWKARDIDSLLQKWRTIQSRFRPSPSDNRTKYKDHTIQQFVKFMRQSKVKAALRLVDDNEKGRNLSLIDN